MSEITKLYENAGINQVCNTCELRGFKKLCPTKELCVRTNPPFTAEKQLELSKFIAGCVRVRDLTIRKSNNKFLLETLMTVECDVRECAIEAYTICFCNQPFEMQIASCINHLINANKLTEEEHKQIKEVLE